MSRAALRMQRAIRHAQHQGARFRIDASTVELPAVGTGNQQHAKGALHHRELTVSISRRHRVAAQR